MSRSSPNPRCLEVPSCEICPAKGIIDESSVFQTNLYKKAERNSFLGIGSPAQDKQY